MKYTKKMMMIPQGEYMTLMNMIKGENPLGLEKAETSTEIAKVLNNRKINENIKSKKYQLLFRKRGRLKKEIEEEANKPKRVLLDDDQLKSIEKAATSVPRYLGVAPGTIQQPSKRVVVKTLKQRTSIHKASIKPSAKKTKLKKTASAQLGELEDGGGETSKAHTKPAYIIHPDYYKDIVKIVGDYKIKLNINNKGEVGGIPGSNYKTILKYLTLPEGEKPAGTDYLMGKMQNEKYFKEALDWAEQHRQEGTGRKMTQKGNDKKFKPTLWIRL